MIRLRCASCGQEAEVESMIAAGQQACTTCGRMIIGGAAPPAGIRDSAIEPWEYEDDASGDRPPARSAGVTVLGIVLIVFAVPGLLFVVCCGGLVGPFLFQQFDYEAIQRHNRAMPRDRIDTQDLEEKVKLAQTLVAISLGVIGVVSVLQLIAGAGVLRRRQWGRYLALANGVLSCLGAFYIAWNGGNLFVVIANFVFFACIVFVLLGEQGVAEFRYADAWRFP